MSAITICGGVYHESCVWPEWDQIYGSGGRAAAALMGHIDNVTLKSYATDTTAEKFTNTVADVYKFRFSQVATAQSLSFRYVHGLSIPAINPSFPSIKNQPPFEVSEDVVLRFGMLEGSAKVDADVCIYDPQSAFCPEPFTDNGSTSRRLAIVGNRSEIIALGKKKNHQAAARGLLKNGADIVIVKMGVAGALVVTPTHMTQVPCYQSDRVWPIGSGDIFAAIFASSWGVHKKTPVKAAQIASKAVAEYVNSMSLPARPLAELSQARLDKAQLTKGHVYLAGPFFTLGQRWVVDEARRCLRELGMTVFSPIHDVGPGPAETIAPKDLAQLDKCDVVFAILDGLDPGTLVELGYARSKGKPVYAFSQTVNEEDLKMVVGLDCGVYDDFVTALHHTVWRT